MRQDLAKHRVVALVPSRVAAFELGIVAEVFGLERPELDVPWWYSLTVCTERPGLVRAGAFGVQIEHGLEALRGADTLIVPSWTGEPSAEVAGRGAGVPRPRRLDLQRGLPPRRRGPARRPGGGDALALRLRAGRPLPRRARQRRRPVRRRRRRADERGQRRGDRPVPAHRAPRSRQRDRQRGRAPARDPAAPRRRPGAADRAAGGRAARRRPDRRRHGLGAGAAGRAARPVHARRPRVHERAHVHPPLPGARPGSPRGAG